MSSYEHVLTVSVLVALAGYALRWAGGLCWHYRGWLLDVVLSLSSEDGSDG